MSLHNSTHACSALSDTCIGASSVSSSSFTLALPYVRRPLWKISDSLTSLILSAALQSPDTAEMFSEIGMSTTARSPSWNNGIPDYSVVRRPGSSIRR